MRPYRILSPIALLLTLALSACGASTPEPTPTFTTGQIQTAAVSTFAADLTQTAFYQPTATFTPSPEATNTLSATFSVPTQSTAAATVPVGVVTSCNNLVYISDVTVPDNTVMNPGQSFTKTWRVQNTGSCAWGAGYKFSLIAGDAMGAQALTITQTVAPGATYELSVPMTAPSAGSSTISATWRMSDAAGAFFGDALTVVIKLGTGGSTAPAATTEAPPTATTGAPPAATATTGTP